MQGLGFRIQENMVHHVAVALGDVAHAVCPAGSVAVYLVSPIW